MKNLTRHLILTSVLISIPCFGRASGDVGGPDAPTLQVPVTDSRPVIDGKLDEPSWQGAAATGLLQVTRPVPGKSTTEAFILRDDGHLYVAVRCRGDLTESDEQASGESTTAEPSTTASPPIPLPISPGSFIRVAKGLPADQSLQALTIECWVRPRQLNAWQSLIGQHNYPTACGYSLGIDANGRIGFYVGDGGEYQSNQALQGPALAQDQWQHVVGTWDGKTKSLWIDGRLVAQEAFEGPVRPGTAPLWLGACGHNGPAVNHLQGDLAMPAIYSRALSADEIEARYRDQGHTPAAGDAVLACWSDGRRPRESSGRPLAARPTWPRRQLGDRHGVRRSVDRLECRSELLLPDSADAGGRRQSRSARTTNTRLPGTTGRGSRSFEFAVAWDADGWTAEFELALRHLLQEQDAGTRDRVQRQAIPRAGRGNPLAGTARSTNLATGEL